MIGGNLVMTESAFLIPTDEIRIPVAQRKIQLNLNLFFLTYGGTGTLFLLKSRQVYFKLTQLICGTFPRHFLKKSKQISKQWHTTRKRTSQNSGCQKKKFKIVWEKFQHRAGSICSKLDSTLVCRKTSKFILVLILS